VSVPLTGVEAKVGVGNVGTVADGPTPLGGREIRYAAPTGSQSSTSLVDNDLAAHVKAPVDIGRPGEPRVLACIVAYLAGNGKIASRLPATDHLGEDGVLQIIGERVVVQVVTVNPRPGFWGGVAKGDGQVLATLTEAVDWIHAAIVEKAKLYPPEDKSSMLLAVDLVHIGVLAGPDFAARYHARYGDPSLSSAFGAVWLVGPTESRVCSLGSSRW